MEKIKRYAWIGWLFLVGILYLVFKRRGDKLEKAKFELMNERFVRRVEKHTRKLEILDEKYKDSLRTLLNAYVDITPQELGLSPEQYKKTIQLLRQRIDELS